MRNSYTAVIERNSILDGPFATEPYEAGWASEARWFVRVLQVVGEGALLRVQAEISPDGLFWCGEGSSPLEIRSAGLYSFRLCDFGSWLRLRCEVQGASFKVIIYLALKE